MSFSNNDSKIHYGILLMLLAGLSFSMMSALAKFSSKEVPITQVAFFRMFINLIFVSVIIHFKKVSYLGNNIPLLTIRGLLGAISLGLCFYAITLIPLVDVTIIARMSALFTAIFALFLLKETLTLTLIRDISLGFIGLILIIKPSWNIINWGGIAALTASMLIGLISIAIKKLHDTEDPRTTIFYFCFIGSLGFALIYGREFIIPNTNELLSLIAMGVCGTFGQFFYTYSYIYGKASELTPFIYSEVVFAALFGAIYFKEIPDIWTILGTVIVILCGISILRRQNTKVLRT